MTKGYVALGALVYGQKRRAENLVGELGKVEEINEDIFTAKVKTGNVPELQLYARENLTVLANLTGQQIIEDENKGRSPRESLDANLPFILACFARKNESQDSKHSDLEEKVEFLERKVNELQNQLRQVSTTNTQTLTKNIEVPATS